MAVQLEDQLLSHFIDSETAASLLKSRFSDREMAQILCTGVPEIRAYKSGRLSERTIDDVFELVQSLNLRMCQDIKYHKLSFAKRDKIVARRLGISHTRASQARRAVFEFSRFSGRADRYIMHNRIPPHKLFEIIQAAVYTARHDRKYKNRTPPQLDEIIGNWLGYSQDTLTHYRVAAGHYTNLRRLVPEGAREVRYRPAEETFMRVFRLYRLCVRNSEDFADLPRLKQYEKVGRTAHLSWTTVCAIKTAHGAYAPFGGFEIVLSGYRSRTLRRNKS